METNMERQWSQTGTDMSTLHTMLYGQYFPVINLDIMTLS